MYGSVVHQCGPERTGDIGIQCRRMVYVNKADPFVPQTRGIGLIEHPDTRTLI